MKLLLLAALLAANPVHVKPSVTKRGVYRSAHVRTAPNRTQRDNWSAKGNVNPYTAKVGHKRIKR